MEERIMKKAYSRPAIFLEGVVTMDIIAASTQNLNDAVDYSEGGTLTGARRRSIWDADDEEDGKTE